MKQMNKLFATLMVALFLLTTVTAACPVQSDAATEVTLLVDTEPAAPSTTITATPLNNSYSAVTAVTDTSGTATLSGLSTSTKWNITGGPVGTTVSQMKTLEPSSAYSTYAMTLSYDEKYTYTLNYNSALFAGSSPSLSYGGDASGFTKVLNTVSSGLTSIDEGSWTVESALIDACYYGVYGADGELLGKLNPDNLTLYTDGSSALSDIRTNNVMWCVPTFYVSSTSTTLTISNDPTTGIAYAHTFNDHIYEICGLGVYEGTVSGGKLMSISDATPTANTTRPNFRTYASANVVENGHAMVWNWDQYQAYKYLYLFAACDFNSQGAIGWGNSNGSASSTTGQCNTMGMFAGNKAASTSSPVKCYIENAWGSLFEFIDNSIYYGGYIYDGNTSTITDSTSGKTSTVVASSGGYPSAISTSANAWGWGTAFSGSSSNGTYDYQSGVNNTTAYAPFVGGGWGHDANAGVSYVSSTGLTNSVAGYGARLAYVCDADAASPVTTVNVTLQTNNGQADTTVAVATGATLPVPAQPAYEGHFFTGWYSDADCTEDWNFATPVSVAMTLYAGWTDTLYFTSAPTQSVVVTPATVVGTFVFSAFGSGGSDITWDFGDGTTGEGLYAQHTYEESGTYTYTATITNSEGSVIFSDDVDVTIPQEGPNLYLIVGSIGALAAAAGLVFRRPAVIVVGIVVTVAGFGAGVLL